jgi:hypothetical protein
MIHAALRYGKKALKRTLKGCGLATPLRAIQRRVMHAWQMDSPPSLDPQFDRTRVSIAVQAEMTRAAIARETDLIHAVVRMQAASMAAALAEQSDQTRSLVFDLIQGYHSDYNFAAGSTGHDVGDSELDASGFLDALRQKLQAPLTAAEIIGAFKIICAQLPQPEKVRELLQAHRRDSFEPAAVFSKIFELTQESRDRISSSGHGSLETQFRLGCSDNAAKRRTA